MDFFKRLQGVFFEPKATFENVAEKPLWIDVLIFVLVLTTVFIFVITPTLRREQAQMMRDNPKLEEKLGKDRYQATLQALEGPMTPGQVIQTFVGTTGPLAVGLLIQASLLLIFGRFMSSGGTYRQVFAALVHASVINALLGNGVRLILFTLKKSVMQTSTSLALLFPHMEVTSTAYVVLTQVDFFHLWLYGVLAFGLAAIFKINIRKALFLSYLVWFLKALFTIGYTLFFMSLVR